MTNQRVSPPRAGHKWKERKGSGAIRTWQPGMKVEGRFCGHKPGKFGELLVLKTAEGEETFAMPAILADRVKGIQDGTMLSIECTGKTKVKAGEAWNFTVMEEARDEGEGDDDDLAF